jgi:nicotinamide-nucleotide amidase
MVSSSSTSPSPGAFKVATLAIGDELLDGRLADTNSQRLAETLFELGLSIERAWVVSDDEDVIIEALKTLSATHQLIVTSGGLGPTSDDKTAEAVARAAGCGIRTDQEALASIIERFASRGIPMPDNNKRQAEVPEHSRTYQNGAGISPAFVTALGDAEVWSFPGVPSEYDWFTHACLMPALRERLKVGEDRLRRRNLRCLGITESGLAAAVEGFEQAHPEVRVQYRTRFPENHLRLVAAHDDATMDALADEARRAIGGSVYAIGDDDLEVLLIRALTEQDKTVAVAESCTGGLIAARLTDVPGASAALLGGVVAYANSVKEALLDVKSATLEAHGAVSEEVAAEMAVGVRERLGADFGLSVTGVAGPGGGSEDKPVGTVCFGLATADGVSTKRRFLPWLRREWIRQMSASVLMRWLLKELER